MTEEMNQIVKDSEGMDRKKCPKEETNFVCKICDKEFKDGDSLNNHMNEHNA